MTLGEMKNAIYMLLDEHSAGGEIEHDEDIEEKMTDFIYRGMMECAKIVKLTKAKAVQRDSRTSYSLPEGMSIKAIYADGKPAGSRFRVIADKLLVPEYDRVKEIIIEYYAFPERIPEDAEDDYELDIREDCAQAIPYYVCAQQLLPDLVTDYGAFLMMWNNAAAGLARERYGTNRVQQAFWRG